LSIVRGLTLLAAPALRSNYLTSISSPTMPELRHFVQHGQLMVIPLSATPVSLGADLCSCATVMLSAGCSVRMPLVRRGYQRLRFACCSSSFSPIAAFAAQVWRKHSLLRTRIAIGHTVSPAAASLLLRSRSLLSARFAAAVRASVCTHLLISCLLLRRFVVLQIARQLQRVQEKNGRILSWHGFEF
jgi:hypothetical protein